MDYLNTLWKKISLQEKVCFFSALIIGYMTHGYALTNVLTNGDGSTCFYSCGIASELGRWFLKYWDKLTAPTSVPWFNGSMSILMVAISAALICRILECKRSISAILLSAIFVTFPSFGSTMIYMFTMDLYAAGLLFAILAAYLLTRGNKWLYPFGILSMIFSLATYQAYICFTITLLLLHMLRTLFLSEEKDVWRTQIIQGIQYVVILILGVVLYWLECLHIYPGIVNEAEHNIGETMSSVNFLRMPKLAAKGVFRFFRYFILGDYSFINTPWHVINVLTLILFFIVWVLLLQKYVKEKLRFALLIVVTALLPLAVGFVDVMAPDAAFTTLMNWQYCLVYIALLNLLEMYPVTLPEISKKHYFQILSLIVVICIVATVYLQYLVTNMAYFRTDLALRRSTDYLNRVITRVESMEGYQEGDPIHIFGSFDFNSVALGDLNRDMMEDLSGYSLEFALMTDYVREHVVRIYLGKDIPIRDGQGEVIESLMSTEEYQQMGIYPHADGIQKINGHWIVKLGE